MRFDAQLVKEQVSLAEIFRGDGHELKKAGPGYFKCRCPFHQEKTASCVVHDRPENYFKCFGCDAGGSVFDYWMKTRGCDFNAAITQLSTGPVPAMISNVGTRTTNEAVSPAPDKLAPRMDEVVGKAWATAVERLRESSAWFERIASWRGYSVETVRWANEQGLIGILPFMGTWREAFLVERPAFAEATAGKPNLSGGEPLVTPSNGYCSDSASSEVIGIGTHPEGAGASTLGQVTDSSPAQFIPVGYHVRLGPKTAGNPGNKASWRYVPTGIGNWPFVLGNVATAKVIYFLEGQWDALALLDCHDSGQKNPLITIPQAQWRIAIVGMRGSTSWKRFMEYYTWSDEVIAFVLGDADTAGATWVRSRTGGSGESFIDALRLRCNRVWGMFPKRGKDFNDVWKERLITRENLVVMLRDKMRHKIKGRRNIGVTFLQFCRAQRARTDAIGDAARIILGDKLHRPTGRKPLKVWERYFHKYVPEQNRSAMYATWREWVRSRNVTLHP